MMLNHVMSPHAFNEERKIKMNRAPTIKGKTVDGFETIFSKF